ncbi:hypothetical protein BCR44DRAFT_95084 [Catenaria anguillulae PL171]|uniref:C2 domain-containing protein n=1 Tax=Catenaria anguillulae PL171 TaxID=765915 RepID=A0A1Y2HZ09_9FUNG|nr:hypothetical protein BCR44DRAFT_95084 [Catenaria anguillulae PL171]
MMSYGTLKIACLHGDNLYNCERFTSQDSYVKFTLSKGYGRTLATSGGGTNPTLAETLELIAHDPNLEQTGGILQVECFDKDLFKKDEFIGKGEYDVSKLITSTTSMTSEGFVQELEN